MEYVSTQVFIIALIVGVVLVGAEIFLPGGVLGVIAGLSLVISVIAAFVSPAFTSNQAIMIAFGIGALTIASVVMWMKLFPRTRLGGQMTHQSNLTDAKSQEPGLEALIGQEGVTLTDLRPSGIAMFGNRRTDVITQGDMVDKGKRISVVDVNANRVIVKPIIS